MQSVRVKTAELMEIVKKNRNGHRAIFEKAMDKYRELAIAELEQSIKRARSGDKISRLISLPEPEDHTSEYDTALSMLGMSVDDTVTLEAEDYCKLVLNQWRWAQSFASNTLRYTNGQ